MDELRPKQKKFVKKYIENGGNATQAVYDAGYNVKDDNSAAVSGNQLLRNTKIEKAIASLADAIPNELITEKHKALLNKRDEKGEIDVQAVKAGVDMGYKLKGSYVSENKTEINILPVLVKFIENNENTDTNNCRDTD